MSADKKDKMNSGVTAIEKIIKGECFHHFIVTGWWIRGGHQNATQMRCAHCLCHRSLEELESKEFVEANGFA